MSWKPAIRKPRVFRVESWPDPEWKNAGYVWVRYRKIFVRVRIRKGWTRTRTQILPSLGKKQSPGHHCCYYYWVGYCSKICSNDILINSNKISCENSQGIQQAKGERTSGGATTPEELEHKRTRPIQLKASEPAGTLPISPTPSKKKKSLAVIPQGSPKEHLRSATKKKWTFYSNCCSTTFNTNGVCPTSPF